jgi:hypothetical protein
VRAELCYVPQELERAFVVRILKDLVAPGGRLLGAEYRSRRQDSAAPWIDEVLTRHGFAVARCASGFREGKELARIAVVPASGSK